MNATDTNAYVTQVRTQATNLIVTIQKLAALQDKWTALDLGNTLDNNNIGGDNAGITKTQLAAVIGTTLGAFETLLSQGHATNLHTIALI